MNHQTHKLNDHKKKNKKKLITKTNNKTMAQVLELRSGGCGVI